MMMKNSYNDNNYTFVKNEDIEQFSVIIVTQNK